MWLKWLTWNLPDTIIGLIMFVCISPAIRKIKVIGNQIVVKVSNNTTMNGWGFEGGIFIFSNTNNIFMDDNLLHHEFGHNVPQALVCGPLHIFLSTIPSIIRFWYREYQAKKGKSLNAYDAIWFEKTATEWGTKWFNYMRTHNLFLFDH